MFGLVAFLFLAGGAALLFGVLNHTLLSAQRDRLVAFARDNLTDHRVDAPVAAFGSQNGWTVRGRLRGLRFLLKVEPTQFVLKLDVGVSRGWFDTASARAHPFERMSAWLGGRNVGGSFFVRGASSDQAAMLQGAPLRQALDALHGRAEVRDATLRDGWLEVITWLPQNLDNSEALRVVARAMAAAASVLAGGPGPEVRVRIASRARLARMVSDDWLKVAERATAGVRCPYCHDALGSAAPVLVCVACSTAHHADCLDANGCTVLGCRANGRRTA